MTPPGRNLPVELTRFIGREDELATLRQLVGASRLMTLTGTGGSGKSRLALELAAAPGAYAAEGVVWVELAPVADARLLAREVMHALGAPADGGEATAAAIAATIGARALLLVLDNCEHLVDSCAALVDALLRTCPELRVLATSREALGVRGERAWLVPPLGVPAQDSGEDIARKDAVRLFVDRAGDVVPGFVLTAENAPAIADICRRLDGIPLAIELAAARVKHLPPAQIRDRLSDAFGLLTTGARTSIPRHRTLRAALDWSHDLLPESARIVLRRLAVFRDGFTLEAVTAVVAGEGVAEREVLDLIALLVDRSLVMLREHRGGARYHLLETMRQYAEQRLREAGEEARVRQALAAHIMSLVETLEPAFTTRERREAFTRMVAELDNIREVLVWTHAHAEARHVRLVSRLWWFWFSSGHWVEAERWLMGALALPVASAPGRERAALLFATGALAALRAQPAAARPPLEEAVRIAGALGDARLEAYALNYLGLTWAQAGAPETFEYCGRAESWFRATGDAYGLRLALLLQGIALQVAGRMADAIAVMREAVEIARGFGQDRELAIALQILAMALQDGGDSASAEALLLESLGALRRDPSHLFYARVIECLAIATAHREPRAAAVRLGISDTMRRHVGADRFALDQQRVDALIPVLRERLGERELERARAEGAAMATSEALRAVLVNVDASVAAEPEAPSHAADLVVHALGPFEAWVRGARVVAWPYAKPKELLVLLLGQPRGRTRAEIGRAMWPDATSAQTRNSFHVTLHHLRRTLGHAEWIVHEDERYRVTGEITVEFDGARFEREARAALASTGAVDLPALERVLAVYRGHLLEGESAGPWRDDEQDRLRRWYCEAAMRGAEAYEEQGALANAANLLAAVVAHEPLDENAQRRLLLLWTRTGERARALRHYERFAAQLVNELDMTPEPETVAVYERILGGRIEVRPD